jgi:excisionase family DNA binding protein
MSRQLNTGQLRLQASSAQGTRPGAAVRRPIDRPLTAADVLTAPEVAELLRVPRSTVEDWARRGVIPSRKVGRRRLYLRPSIETLLLEERP